MNYEGNMAIEHTKGRNEEVTLPRKLWKSLFRVLLCILH